MVAWVLAAVVAAAPMEVLVTRRVGLSAAESQDVATRLERALKQAGLSVGNAADAAKRAKHDPAQCANRPGCGRALAEGLGAEQVVTLDVGRIGGRVVLGLEAVAVKGGEPIHALVFTVPEGGFPDNAEGSLRSFALAVKAALPAEPVVVAPTPSVPADAPMRPAEAKPSLTPEPKPAPEVVLASPPPGWRTPVVTTAIAGAALVATVVLAALAAGAAAELGQATAGPVATLSPKEARALVDRGNALTGGAVGLGVVTLGLSGLATWQWVRATEVSDTTP